MEKVLSANGLIARTDTSVESQIAKFIESKSCQVPAINRCQQDYKFGIKIIIISDKIDRLVPKNRAKLTAD